MYTWKCPICEALNECAEEEMNEFEVYCTNCENETYSNELWFIDENGNKISR